MLNTLQNENYFSQLNVTFGAKKDHEKVTILRAINQALVFETKYPPHECEWEEEFDYGDSYNSGATVKERRCDLGKIETNKRIDAETPLKQDFIKRILNNSEDALILSQWLLAVPSSAIEDKSGFVALRKVANDAGERSFNNALAVTVAAKALEAPDSIKAIKESSAYAVVSTHLVSRILTFFSTNTINRIEGAKRFLTDSNETTEQKILKELKTILSEDSNLKKDDGEIAKEKVAVLGELRTLFENNESGDEKKSAKEIFQSWKKDKNAAEILGKPRGFIGGKTNSQKFIEEAEIALSSSSTSSLSH